jgi:Fe-S cluster assembly iron-binding protein IscA
MLQVTDAAVSVLKKVLDQDERRGGGIRLVPNPQPDGRTSVGVEPIREPGPNDEPTEARGLTVVVARDLAPELENAILDAEDTGTGADLLVRPQQTT